ncbi:hypothetical protein GQ54DRAFT_295585 [Martensiomyces pterosporus]|nr:hypothetical protein GQ54DRAFT_295585 [Martensiomyces pterosporus]
MHFASRDTANYISTTDASQESIQGSAAQTAITFVNNSSSASFFQSPETVYSLPVTPRTLAETQIAASAAGPHIPTDYNMQCFPNPDLITSLGKHSPYPGSYETSEATEFVRLQEFALSHEALASSLSTSEGQQPAFDNGPSFGISFASYDDFTQSGVDSPHPPTAYASPVVPTVTPYRHQQHPSGGFESQPLGLVSMAGDTSLHSTPMFADFPLHRTGTPASRCSAGRQSSSIPAANMLADSVPIVDPIQLATPHLLSFPFLSNADITGSAAAAAATGAAAPGSLVSLENSLSLHAISHGSSSNSNSHSIIPSLAATPQHEYAEYTSSPFEHSFLRTSSPSLLGTPTTDTTATFVAGADGVVMASSSALGSTQLAGVGAVRRGNQASRIRPRRALSISESLIGHVSSPNLGSTAGAPHTCAHPYFTHPRLSAISSGSRPSMVTSPRLAHIRGHTRSGSDGVVRPSMKSAHGSTLAPSARRRSVGAASVNSGVRGGAQTRPRARSVTQNFNRLSLHQSKTQPIAQKSNKLAPAPGHGGCRKMDSDEEDDAEIPATPGNRIQLTDDQRREYFIWLYRNSHDPKPKGAERERLRSIGRMSRERFKTWFANARRRYFRVAEIDGVQQYVVNDRFRDVCKRANIQLD